MNKELRTEAYEILKSAGTTVSCFDFANMLSCLSDGSFVCFPGFTDVHVHLREPGFFYKETIASATYAAARGGFTNVCSMPNLNPVPDSLENLAVQLDIIKRDAVTGVHPYGSITKGEQGKELSDMEDMAPYVVGFSDDGRGVQSEALMIEAMKKAKELDKPIVAHCEDNSLLNGGYIHDGLYAKQHGHRGICSKSEWGPIARDIELAKKIGCKYHVCHISTKESVELIRKAKRDGADITCETAPHYLILDDTMLKEDGRFKMNPPIRSKEDKMALIEGIADGTIDMIATDHAPHSAEEKSKGLKDSLMGVVGIETSFPLMYTHFVKEGIISIERLMELMCYNAMKRFNISSENDFSIWDLNNKYTINPDDFVSKGKSTPFAGFDVYGKCMITICNKKIVYVSK